MTAPAPPPAEKRLRALLLSLVVCPGAGQFVLGRRGRGALMLGSALSLTAALMGLVVWGTWSALVQSVPLEDPLAVPRAFGLGLARYRAPLVTGLFALAAVWLWSAADAWWGGTAR